MANSTHLPITMHWGIPKSFQNTVNLPLLTVLPNNGTCPGPLT